MKQWKFDSREMIPSLTHAVSHFQSCLICPKQSQEETTSFNAPQIWTILLGGVGGTARFKKKKKKNFYEQQYVEVHFKKTLISVPLNKNQKTKHLLSMGDNYGSMCVEWIILLLIEEDQNKSSANLFSGLGSGGRVNETHICKNIPGDSDN